MSRKPRSKRSGKPSGRQSGKLSRIDPALQAVRRTWRPHAVYAAAACATTLTALALPLLTARAVDAAVRGGSVTAEVARLVAALALNLLGTIVASRAKSGSVAAVGSALRRSLVRHVLDTGLPATARFRTGDLLARLTGNISVAADIGFAAINCLAACAGALGAMVALATIGLPLAAVYAVSIGVSVLVLKSSVRIAAVSYGRYQAAQARIAGSLTEALTGSQTIHAAGTRAWEARRITAPVPELAAAGRQDWANNGRTGARLTLLAGATELVVLGLCGWSVTEGRLTVGALIAAAGYLAFGLQSVEQLAGVTHFVHMLKAVERVEEVFSLSAAPAKDPAPDPGAAAGSASGLLNEGIRLSGVSVLRDATHLLRDCDLVIPTGEEVAIVGGPGAGKTTLALLIGGLLDADRGTVTLDGVPVAPGQVCYAFERPILVGDTLGQALAYGRPQASPAEVAAACDAARISAFIARLPRGYDTTLDELNCSGGELQRLGIARALVQKRGVIVLDDATSSLDTATEAEVCAAIRTSTAAMTRIVIAHRPGSAARADRVAWLEGGRVRAVGSHHDLWRDPDYRAVYAPAVPSRTSSSPVGAAPRSPEAGV